MTNQKSVKKMNSRSLVDCIGNTPLIRLNKISDATGCEILGKAEFMNPGGSVKDRAALGMVRDAERNNALQPGGIIVEGTAGNTGIGLAVVGNALGYSTVVVMPNNQSIEKIMTLKAYGADVKLVPPVPFKDPNHFVHQSERLAKKLNANSKNGAFWANQFDNVANAKFHQDTTGPEIWEQTKGLVSGFVCSAGTGGTLGGVARALKGFSSNITIAVADPPGSALYDYYTNGTLNLEGSSITEGIGNSRITTNLQGAPIDMAFQIEDQESIPLVYQMIQEEGLCLGGSTGVNVAGAIRLAKELGPGNTIVTILCDSGLIYKARLFNKNFLAKHKIQLPEWLDMENLS